MKNKRAQTIKKIICVVVIFAIILSTLLAFVIPPWAVLIINACAIVVYRILFRKLQFSAIGGIFLYLLVGGILAGVVALVNLYPEKICGGVQQDTYTKNFSGCCWFFAILYLLQGIWLVVDAVRTKDVIFPFHCVVPITLMGGFMIFIMTSLFVWLLYVVLVNSVNTLCALFCEEDGPENWDSGTGGSGGSDKYDIYIVKR